MIHKFNIMVGPGRKHIKPYVPSLKRHSFGTIRVGTPEWLLGALISLVIVTRYKWIEGCAHIYKEMKKSLVQPLANPQLSEAIYLKDKL